MEVDAPEAFRAGHVVRAGLDKAQPKKRKKRKAGKEFNDEGDALDNINGGPSLTSHMSSLSGPQTLAEAVDWPLVERSSGNLSGLHATEPRNNGAPSIEHPGKHGIIAVVQGGNATAASRPSEGDRVETSSAEAEPPSRPRLVKAGALPPVIQGTHLHSLFGKSAFLADASRWDARFPEGSDWSPMHIRCLWEAMKSYADEPSTFDIPFDSLSPQQKLLEQHEWTFAEFTIGTFPNAEIIERRIGAFTQNQKRQTGGL